MKKKGFTLAEVLVTLGIIGVVAALAMPALNSSVQRTKVGPSLRKFMNALENANRMVMQEADVDDLTSLFGESPSPGEGYLNLLNKHFSGGAVVRDSKFPGHEGHIIYRMGSGEEFLPESNYVGTQPKDGTNYKGVFCYLVYDMNGSNAEPNKDGKDIFYFVVDGNGSVLPIGSEAMASAYKNETSYKQADPSKPCFSKDADKEKCAGAIANNNWKVGYKY